MVSYRRHVIIMVLNLFKKQKGETEKKKGGYSGYTIYCT